MCLPQFGDKDITTVSITYTVQNKERTVIVSSVYMAMEDQPTSLRLEQLVHHCMVNNLSLILACDTNSRHPSSGSADTNHQGTVLSEYIATTNLEVANRGSEPTFCAGNRRTVIDVTLISNNLNTIIHDWQVMSNDTVSDHRQIQFAIKCDKRKSIRYRNIWNTNWDEYDAELCARIGMWFGRVDTPADIERELDAVYLAIQKSYHKVCPEHRVSGRNRMPWWNHDLKVLRQKANRAFHKAYKSGLEQDWQAHREVHRSFKKLLRQSKRDSWRNFCSHVEGTHESSRIYKILGRSQAGSLGMLCTPLGQSTTSPEEVYQHLLETHFPGCKSSTVLTQESDTVHNGMPRWQPNYNRRFL